MGIEFDRKKDAANRAKHGYGLAQGAAIFDDPDVLVLAASREIDGETRFKAIGLIEGRIATMVYTWRGENLRPISVRRSNRAEERSYRDPL